MKVMCLKVNPVKLLVKVHLVLSFAPVFSMVYPDINKINYSPFKRQTLQEWYLGQDVMNISHKYSGKYRKLASERITYSFQVVLLSLITKPSIQFFGSLSSFVCHTRTPYVLPQRTYSIFLQGTVNNLMHYERSYSICCYAAPGNSLPLCINAIPSLTRRCLKPCLNNKLDS